MHIKVMLDLNKNAFRGNERDVEIATIFRELAQRVSDEGLRSPRALFDSNDNKVGMFSLSTDDIDIENL